VLVIVFLPFLPFLAVTAVSAEELAALHEKLQSGEVNPERFLQQVFDALRKPVIRSGGMAGIGALDDLADILAHGAGTRVVPDAPS